MGPDGADDGHEAAEECVTLLDRILSHRSSDDSTCSTARDGNQDIDGLGPLLARTDSALSESSLRNLLRMDSNLSEDGGLVDPHEGAGPELRPKLQLRLCRSESVMTSVEPSPVRQRNLRQRELST